MKNNRGGASNIPVIIFLIFLTLVFIIGLLYYQYWHIPRRDGNFNSQQIKKTDFSWKKYKDEKYGFEFYYPKNEITFQNKEAVYYVYLQDKKELSKVSAAANIPFFASIESFTSPEGIYNVYINPIQLSISVLEKPKEYFGLDYFAEDEKINCIEESKKTNSLCAAEKVNINGQDAFRLKVLANDASKPTKEYLFITRSGINYILRLEYDYLGGKLDEPSSEFPLITGEKDEDADSALRKQIIKEIISKGFALN